MKNNKIIIVEDELLIAKLIKKTLNMENIKVVSTYKSAEALLDEIESLNIDLIIMDIKLEGELDGIEAAKLIKKKYNIPILFLTAYADDKILERAMECDPIGYLVKPCRKKDIISSVKTAFNIINSE